jgi:hypothetical protein
MLVWPYAAVPAWLRSMVNDDFKDDSMYGAQGKKVWRAVSSDNKKLLHEDEEAWKEGLEEIEGFFPDAPAPETEEKGAGRKKDGIFDGEDDGKNKETENGKATEVDAGSPVREVKRRKLDDGRLGTAFEQERPASGASTSGNAVQVAEEGRVRVWNKVTRQWEWKTKEDAEALVR